MSKYNIFNNVNITKIRPNGWYKEFLEIQKRGITGNIEKCGFPFSVLGWDNHKKEFGSEEEKEYLWTSYEQTAYALDGQIKCAILLKDGEWIEKIAKKIEKALQGVDEDGYIGPTELKEPKTTNRWPHVVFFRAVQTYYDYTKDSRIIDKLVAHYLNKVVDYTYFRNVLNTEIMLWLYSITNNQRLLDLAIENYKEFDKNEEDSFATKNLKSNKKSVSHGVSYNEFSKLGPLFYSYTGDIKYLEPVIKGYEKVFKYQLLPDGLHSCNENMSDNAYTQTHEMCNVTDFPRSMNFLLKATGDGRYADLAERCVYNAGIGAISKDFTSLQYFSGLNQVVADDYSNHNWYTRGSSWMAYRPNHITPCCTGNSNRFMPEFLLNSFLSKDDGVAVVYYGDNEYDDFNESGIKIVEKSNYPFEDRVSFEISSKKDFSLYLRIPNWCKNPKLFVNGKKLEVLVEKGFVKCDLGKGESRVELEIPSEVEMVDYKGGVFVQKGCLLFAYDAGDRKEESTVDNGIQTTFPKWNIYAEKPWNYAIEQDKGFKFIQKEINGYPWISENSPFEIEISAKRLKNWVIKERTKIKTTYNPKQKNEKEEVGRFIFTPAFPEVKSENLATESEKIKLVPYGTTMMRISVFPKIEG